MVPRLALTLLLGLVAGALRAAPSPITVFLAGDSTMAEKLEEKRPETGWGERLQALFDPAEVRVENHARNGRSTRTFIEEGRWDALVERVRPGDHVLIQFGHNDQSEDKPDRYTPPDRFQANLARFVGEVRARGGVPVLLTPIVRRRFDPEGAFYDVHGEYPDLVRAVAAETEAPLLDLHRASRALLEASGAEASQALFLWLEPGEHPNYPEGVRDNTHFSPAGAEALARLVAEALREGGLPLAAHLRQQPDAIVDGSHAGPSGALGSGTPTYRTLTEALAAAPEGDRPYVVALRDGRYYEKVTVERPGVHLIGESREGTVLTYDAVAGAPAPGGGTYGTRGSATLTIRAPDFRAERLTIENGFDYPANRALPPDDPARVQAEQAVALLTEGASDRTVLQDCVISGHQDTLFLDAGRHHVSDCTVLGHVDFVFGAGRAVFERVELVSRDRGSPEANGYVTAASTRRADHYGFLFLDCRLRKEHPGMAPGSVALGRPWHPSADPLRSPSVVFLRCHMEDHVSATGWVSMGSTSREGERYTFEPLNARLFEHGSTGPGAHASPSRRVLTEGEVRAFTPERVLEGWSPEPR